MGLVEAVPDIMGRVEDVVRIVLQLVVDAVGAPCPDPVLVGGLVVSSFTGSGPCYRLRCQRFLGGVGGSALSPHTVTVPTEQSPELDPHHVGHKNQKEQAMEQSQPQGGNRPADSEDLERPCPSAGGRARVGDKVTGDHTKDLPEPQGPWQV